MTGRRSSMHRDCWSLEDEPHHVLESRWCQHNADRALFATERQPNVIVCLANWPDRRCKKVDLPHFQLPPNAFHNFCGGKRNSAPFVGNKFFGSRKLRRDDARHSKNLEFVLASLCHRECAQAVSS